MLRVSRWCAGTSAALAPAPERRPCADICTDTSADTGADPSADPSADTSARTSALGLLQPARAAGSGWCGLGLRRQHENAVSLGFEAVTRVIFAGL